MKREDELHPTRFSATEAEPHAADDVFLLPAVLHPLSLKVDGIDLESSERLKKFISPNSSIRSQKNQDEISD